MATDANRLAAALAYEDERKRRLAETIPALTGPTTAPRRSVRTDLENLSAGLGQGITTQLEGIKGLITDPVGTAKGAYEAARAVVRDPSVLAAALSQMGQKAMSGPLGAGEVIGEMVGPRKTGPVMAELDVYHGTPHRFPATEANPLGEFDASKIGTGEGAQAFGHGIYLAENPTIAKEYVKNPLNDVFLNERGEFLRQRLLQKQNDSQILSEYREKYNETPEEAAKDFQSLKKLMNESASFYKADLPDEMIDRMLDWDKPLSEQHPEVVSILEQRSMGKIKPGARLQIDGSAYSPIGEPTGADIYNYLSNAYKDSKKASETLKQLGIPGIKYLDAGSRGQGGSGTRNFVVFPGEEKKVRILERK